MRKSLIAFMAPALCCAGLLAATLAAPDAAAQSSTNPECLGTNCGHPHEQGGGCSCSCGCSVWVSQTDDGKTLSYTDDADGDGISDSNDNCPYVPNRDQKDTDGDGVGDACDNCPNASNPDQLDINANGIGYVCDADDDGDGVPTASDNCPTVPNPSQWKWSGSGNNKGGDCDPAPGPTADGDHDGIPNGKDNCPRYPNADQVLPADQTLCGPISVDTDKDGIADANDNCPTVANPDQKDTFKTGIGDACNKDIDGDGVFNATKDGFTPVKADNCPAVANKDQIDTANDGVGDACRTGAFCYVFDKTHPQDCLDPQKPFTIAAGAPPDVKLGEHLNLSLIANRNSEAISYKYTVVSAPSGSNATVESPTGFADHSLNWVYTPSGNAPKFTPDKSGAYLLQVDATLAVPDRAYPMSNKSSAQLSFNVGNGNLGGCGNHGKGAILIPGLGMLAALTRRIMRRRQ